MVHSIKGSTHAQEAKSWHFTSISSQQEVVVQLFDQCCFRAVILSKCWLTDFWPQPRFWVTGLVRVWVGMGPIENPSSVPVSFPLTYTVYLLTFLGQELQRELAPKEFLSILPPVRPGCDDNYSSEAIASSSGKTMETNNSEGLRRLPAEII